MTSTNRPRKKPEIITFDGSHIMIRMSLCALVAVCSLWITAHLPAAQFEVSDTDKGVVVKLDGKLLTEYLTLSGNKPILWPIIGPGGEKMTRSYPMEDADGEKRDHIHHRSLWLTHGEVNGISFWHEGKNTGTIKHKAFKKKTGGKTAEIVTENDWIAPDGKTLLSDVRTLKFLVDGTSRIIDFDATITAVADEVELGDTKEGTFGIRVPAPMKPDLKKGGKIVNAEGLTDKAAWGKASPWVDYHGPVDGKTVGITIMNHPSSFRYPTHWHVRTYGLFAANPFGLKHFTGKPVGKLVLKKGQSFTLRHRVIFHNGDEKEADIAGQFKKYAR